MTATVLEDVRTFIRRFVVLDDHQAVAVALWIAHTHVYNAFDCTPYLEITSAEKRSGKSRLLEASEVLVREPAKGTALEGLRSSVGADAVVYLGDDVTDNDAFAVLGQDDLAISIGPTPTGAAFQVASPRAAAEVLGLLADERARLTA